ncbi:hypothetical protein [Pseudoalteromonas sp. McH1-42]|uniref:hypothetical protein n=1 Tax=Pseudoalteromonas sp. McH1-42 TaxID=2917752 RepID=UPI001EF68440|nr:hypothetical protein [Pseudoalteromonas sp. McH1-42]MCG7560340.1 hypothetical protein [Pseudoalteromonas sp. McH1-42]
MDFIVKVIWAATPFALIVPFLLKLQILQWVSQKWLLVFSFVLSSLGVVLSPEMLCAGTCSVITGSIITSVSINAVFLSAFLLFSYKKHKVKST